MKRVPSRRGYALMLVLFFMVLLLSLASVAYRQVAAMLRVESVRLAQVARDQGSLLAVARALALLQTGLPPSNPYVCGVTIDTPSGPRAFTITMTSQISGQWTIDSAPTQADEHPVSMPASF